MESGSARFDARACERVKRKGYGSVMSVMDKFLNYMRLNDSDEDYYDDEDEYDEEEPVQPAPRKASRAREREREEDDYSYEEKSARKPAQNKITSIRQTSSRRSASVGGMEVCVIKPTSVEEAREITETLLSNRTVVLNLEGLDVDIAQRIIDFTSGSCFAIGGNLQKISHYIFIVTPSSVDISGDFQDIFGGVSSLDSPISKGL